MPFVALGIVIVVVVLGSLMLLIGRLRGMANDSAQNVRDRFAGRTLHYFAPNANFFGQQSLGMGQMRGNGTLALTDDELYFLRWAPQKEFVVPLPAIESVVIARSHLGKTRFGPLVKVIFTDEHGASDSMAWQVKDPYNLKQQLEELISPQS
jgi:hypothetical protein